VTDQTEGAPSAEGIRVLLADDHPPTRAGVRYTLEHAGMVICAEAGDAAGAVEAAIREKPDLCLIDVHMPGSGIAATKAITDALPETSVIMLTVSRDDNDLFDALRAGASGYLLKDMDPDRIPNALLGVLAGEAALPRTLLIRVMDEFRERGRRRRVSLAGRKTADLTDREWEVLHLLRDGATTAEIANRLFVSQATVRSHVAAVLRKLKVKDRREAIELFDEG
jgi:DNA-binding NarL/FixJ family response regulator